MSKARQRGNFSSVSSSHSYVFGSDVQRAVTANLLFGENGDVDVSVAKQHCGELHVLQSVRYAEHTKEKANTDVSKLTPQSHEQLTSDERAYS